MHRVHSVYETKTYQNRPKRKPNMPQKIFSPEPLPCFTACPVELTIAEQTQSLCRYLCCCWHRYRHPQPKRQPIRRRTTNPYAEKKIR